MTPLEDEVMIDYEMSKNFIIIIISEWWIIGGFGLVLVVNSSGHGPIKGKDKSLILLSLWKSSSTTVSNF